MATQPASSGLRLQLILSLFGLMLLSFLPLFFAISSLARISLITARGSALTALGRAVSLHVDDVMVRSDTSQLADVLGAHLRDEGLDAIGVYSASHALIAASGAIDELPRVLAVVPQASEKTGVELRVQEGGYIGVVARLHEGELVIRVRPNGATGRDGRFTGLIAIYFVLIAITLVTFAYFFLTRLIVRPLDELVAAADRVASGTRTFDVPRGGPREVAELANSVRAMATALIREEDAQKKRVSELVVTTTNLIAAREQLVRSERMASVGHLAAGLAHEIGNPIAALLGLIDLVLAGDLPRETERDFIVRIHREAERIHGIVRNLLEFARPEAIGVESAERATADVFEVVKNVSALLKPQKEFRAIELSIEIPTSLPRALIPPARLTQVLLNVIMNAAQSIAGSEPRKGTVVVSAFEREGCVVIGIEDDGPGISKAIATRLFEPFATTKPVGSGTGLGLAVCRGIIEGAGGTIVFETERAQGARFVVTLPARKS